MGPGGGLLPLINYSCFFFNPLRPSWTHPMAPLTESNARWHDKSHLARRWGRLWRFPLPFWYLESRGKGEWKENPTAGEKPYGIWERGLSTIFRFWRSPKSVESGKNEKNVAMWTFYRTSAYHALCKKCTTYFYKMLVILNIIRHCIMLPLGNKPLLLSYSSYMYSARIYE